MDKFKYQIVVQWSDEDQVYIARVPALGTATHGDTAEEAVKEAQVAGRLMLEVLIEEGYPVPSPWLE